MLFNKTDSVFLLGCFLCLFTIMNFISQICSCVTGEITMYYGYILCIIVESKIPRYKHNLFSVMQHLSSLIYMWKVLMFALCGRQPWALLFIWAHYLSDNLHYSLLKLFCMTLAVWHSKLFWFVVIQGSCILIWCITVTITFLLTKFKEYFGNVFFCHF